MLVTLISYYTNTYIQPSCKAVIMDDIITLRGERGLWLDFTHKVRKDRRNVWQVLKPYLKKYINSNDEHRVLLLLFPAKLVDELVKGEDPDGFVEQAIRNHLESGG
jgi:hypothetical protein